MSYLYATRIIHHCNSRGWRMVYEEYVQDIKFKTKTFSHVTNGHDMKVSSWLPYNIGVVVPIIKLYIIITVTRIVSLQRVTVLEPSPAVRRGQADEGIRGALDHVNCWHRFFILQWRKKPIPSVHPWIAEGHRTAHRRRPC